jgi:UPF0755 protein
VRRAAAAIALAAAGFAAGLLLAACGGGGKAALETTATTPSLERLRIIFPEGFNVREMGTRVAEVRRIAIAKRGVQPKLTRAQYLAAAARARPPKAFLKDWKRGKIEGFLFPALYEFSQYTTGKELVDDQLVAFRRSLAKVSLQYARSKNLTPYDVLTIASMIEKEAVEPNERRLVAAVIYNRLHNRMPLGIDATIRYGLGIPGTKSLTKAALGSSTPYNSRRFPGLPPTPIANPGLASLQAAAHPARVGYLYYVRVPGTRRHFFTASEAEFLRKVCSFGYACQ